MPLFAERAAADSVTAGLFEDADFYGFDIHAFVVMPEHFHLLLTLPALCKISELLDRIKSNAARRTLHVCSECIAAEMDKRRRLNSRKVWQRGFRSVQIDKESAFLQKI